jgi:hypothetical protein
MENLIRNPVSIKEIHQYIKKKAKIFKYLDGGFALYYLHLAAG